MTYKLFPAPPTAQEVAEALRIQLASQGYFIYSLSKRHRKSIHDFVAAAKDDSCNSNFVLVRISGYRVHAHPFGLMSNTLPARTVIESLSYGGKRVVRSAPQVDPRRRNLRLEHFVPPGQLPELAELHPQLGL